jgi:hypothetical protein
MDPIVKIIESEAEYLSKCMHNLGVSSGDSYSYYQGCIDALSWALAQLSREDVKC